MLGPSGTTVRFRGEWRPGEIRPVDLPSGTVVTIGQCFATAAQLRHGAALALRTGDCSALTRWPGAYACLVLRGTDVTLLEDVAGQYPLYYRHAGGRLWFGDRPAAVSRAAGREPRPDAGVLAAWVLCPEVPGLTGGGSPVEGVLRLGAGHALRAGLHGAPRRWAHEPLLVSGPSPAAGATAAAEAAEAVGEALRTAVRVRAERAARLTTDFSGGLDSTSLAFLALDHRPGGLPAFCYHQPGSPCDDLPYARRYAALDHRLRLETVTGNAQTLSFQGLGHLGLPGPPPDGHHERHGRHGPAFEPDPAAASLARTRLRLSRLAAAGADIHLGGEGGDALFSVSAAYLADLVRPGALRRLRGDGWLLARRHHTAPAAVLARAARLSRTDPAAALHRLAGRLEHPGGAPATWLGTLSWWTEPGTETAWFTPSARRHLAGLARRRAAEAAARQEAPPLSPAEHRARCGLRASAAVQRHLSDHARAYGVWPQAPFLDHGVVRAALALPAPLRARPPAPKPLLAAALAGAVPPEVLARRTKGDYGFEDQAGARAASAAMRALPESSRLADLGVLEPGAVLDALERGALGVRTVFPALTRLLAVEAGLRAPDTPHDDERDE